MSDETKPAKAEPTPAETVAVEIPAAGNDPDSRKRMAKTRLAAAENAGDTDEAKSAKSELDNVNKELRQHDESLRKAAAARTREK